MSGKQETQPYSMSFTTATLMEHETTTLMRLFDEVGDWDAVRARVLGENLFQTRTATASTRLYREAKSRIDRLTQAQRQLVLRGSAAERRQVLWLAMCRRYPFIGEFATRVVREKFLRLDLVLTDADYDTFFSDRAAWHAQILQLTEQTRAKQKSVVYKSLREAELMDRKNRLQPALISGATVAAIRADDAEAFLYFTVTDQEIAAWTRP